MKTYKSVHMLFFILICFMGCSSDDSTTEDALNPDGYKEPDFNPNSSWIYMEDCPSLENYYSQNNRPQFRKWVASKKGDTFIFTDNSFLFGFENSDKYTRYLTDKLNPNGKETLTVLINNFTKNPPETGNYILNGAKEGGYCWYDVLDYKNAKIDSTRTQSLEPSSFTITNWSHVVTSGKYSIYAMSGNGVINIMYWKNGTSSTTDIHKLLVTFNKVEVTFTD